MKINFKHEIKADEPVDAKQIIDIILKTRGIKELSSFLTPPSPLEIDLKYFGFTKEIDKTLRILEDIKKNKKKIVVYTDYDADGITGGAILWETLYALGFDAMPYVPHRQLEGYGFSKKGIDNVKKLYDPALIISVDHGITAAEKVTYAKSLGIPIIITDHHLKPEKIPTDAEVIFHIPQLSGSGVAYYVAKEIFTHFRNDAKDVKKLENYFETDYLTLASIGTIADLVPLIGPSRNLVKYGLAACVDLKRIGLKHIFKEAKIMDRKITPYEVGYIVAPRINAIGRLEHAIDALRLLCTTSEEEAFNLAGKIGDKNRARQDMVKESVEEAKKMVDQLAARGSLPSIIILQSDHWHEGIIGLIASKLLEEYYRPTIVMTKVDGFFKGSARSIPSLHITNFLRELKDYLIDAGGHVGAAGFTIEEKQLEQFKKKAAEKANKEIQATDLEKTIEVDLKIPLSKLNLRVAKYAEALQPFGIGNRQPTFYSEAEVIDARIFGKNNDHLKIFVKDKSQSSFPLELIAFGKAAEFHNLTRGKAINIVYSLEIDTWSGVEKLRGRLSYLSVNEML